MTESFKYPAQQAASIVHRVLKPELGIHAFDEPQRSKVHLFAIRGRTGKQFAIVMGEYDEHTGQHNRQQSRIILERCILPAISGVDPVAEPYEGSRIKKQRDSKLADPNQVSCVVRDEAALTALIRWYADQP
jgi:hypothetical protein